MRYSGVSVTVLALDQVVLFLCFGVAHWSTTQANLIAFALLTGPSFYANRRWVWGDSTPGTRFMGQVLPFWVLGIVGLLLSIWATGVVAAHTDEIADRHFRALVVNVASVAAYGLVWGLKFVLLTAVVFNPARTQPKA
jgi:putative flippase GtrA